MLSVSEARERILSAVQPLASETVPLAQGARRVLAQDVAATDDLPLFDNSTMDGFALRAADTEAGAVTSLRVVGDVPAGTAPTVQLGPGEAARIMTGAQLPDGADAVIPVEDTDFQNREPGTPAPQSVKLSRSVSSGENVRRRGLDVHRGDRVLNAGRVLKPQDVGLLAMLGIANLQVFRTPRVALISSGDELLQVDAPLEPGKIRDSNSFLLSGLLEDSGAAVVRLGVARDDPLDVEARLRRAVDEGTDLILSSAGVSVGAYDYVRAAVEAQGRLDFWRVNMRPGKPLAFGQYRGIPFLGLPGNPVSAFVAFEVFVREAIGKMAGRPLEPRPRVAVQVAGAIHSDGRESYLRAEVYQQDGRMMARLTGHQGSGNLLSLVRANALLIIPAGVKSVPAKWELDAWML